MVVTTEIDRGFDTGSAALGAGGSAAILLLGAVAGPRTPLRRHHDVDVQHDVSFTWLTPQRGGALARAAPQSRGKPYPQLVDAARLVEPSASDEAPSLVDWRMRVIRMPA